MDIIRTVALYHELVVFCVCTLVPPLALFPLAKLLEDAATLLRLSLD